MTVKTEVPTLGDYVTLPEAASILGVTKQAMHQRRHNFRTLRRIGTKALYVVSRSELDEYGARREAARPVAVGKPVSRLRAS